MDENNEEGSVGTVHTRSRVADELAVTSGANGDAGFAVAPTDNSEETALTQRPGRAQGRAP
jgi:hypothetical protein